jgi:hypothetical protein
MRAYIFSAKRQWDPQPRERILSISTAMDIQMWPCSTTPQAAIWHEFRTSLGAIEHIHFCLFHQRDQQSQAYGKLRRQRGRADLECLPAIRCNGLEQTVTQPLDARFFRVSRQ